MPTLTRRTALAAALGAVALTRADWTHALAQAATPTGTGADLGALGLPEITITVDARGYAGVPSSLAAGRYLVTITNATTGGTNSVAAAFLKLPAGVTAADLSAGPSQATPDAASPAATPDATAGGVPAWFYTTTLAGGPSAAPGQTVRGVVELTAGDWVVWGDDPAAAKPVPVTVTGQAAATTTLAADVMVDEVKTADGFAFRVNGSLRHGKQLIRIANQSDQPHFLLMTGSPVPLTKDQLQMLLSLPDGATPEPASCLPDPATLTTGVYAATQSPGTTQWIEADLTFDTYVLLCFISDPTKGGMPHAAEGMADVLTVGGA